MSGLDFQAHTIAAGFAHSAAIDKRGCLHVWGDNSNQQLQKIPEDELEDMERRILRQPTPVPLVVKHKKEQPGGQAANPGEGDQFKATNVACGPASTWVVASRSPKTSLPYDDDVEGRTILKKLRSVLYKEGTLVGFFGLHELPPAEVLINEEEEKEDDAEEQESAQESSSSEFDGNDKDRDDQIKISKLAKKDPFNLKVAKDNFRDRIRDHGYCDQPARIRSLAKVIVEQKRNRLGPNADGAEDLVLGDIEDYALGFMQNNTKLFVFGRVAHPLKCFESKPELAEEMNLRGAEIDTHLVRNRDKGSSKIRDTKNVCIVLEPTTVQFPKFTKPIVSISCGFSHVLAVTLDYKLFSWGDGSYGALGFGDKVDRTEPARLEIYDHQGRVYKIIQAACGKQHSMCLTNDSNIYSWGKCANGRLGHDDEPTDLLSPKEIYRLSQRKPIFIACGESHSAAISEKRELFTWGHGGYGRLGHGTDERAMAPTVVDALKHLKTLSVSCGFNHTLALTVNGKGERQMWAFGQNKYGKLGVHYQKMDHSKIATYAEPVAISMYRDQDGHVFPEKVQDVAELCAGYNHSLALTRRGKPYSWGYHGKAVLGRPFSENGDNKNNQYYKALVALAVPFGVDLKGKKDAAAKEDDILEQYRPRARKDDTVDEKDGGGGQQSKEKKGGVLRSKPMADEEEVVVQVCCGSNTTVALTSAGTVHVLGDNTFGQHACEVDALPENPKSEFGKYSRATKVDFQFNQKNKNKIIYVACGGDHAFAQSALDEIYGWGRNDEGQLGVGFLTESVTEPTYLKDISFKGIKQICCQENYSAALSIYGLVYVAGSLSGGKLGLGKGQKRGFQLRFRPIPSEDLPEIDFIACGMSHMLAISRYSDDPALQTGKRQTGTTYAWGKNLRGQLGIGSRENQFSPMPIQNTKERFRKVACGYNFSLGLSPSNKVYFWGNLKYSTEMRATKDYEEPILLTALEGNEVHDISCEAKQCFALLDDGTLRKWGKFLLAKDINAPKVTKPTGKGNKKEEQKKETRIESAVPFPASTSTNRGERYRQIATGPNHAAAITVTRKAYVWGFNNLQNRLGLKTKADDASAKEAPQVLFAMEQVLQEQNERRAAHKAHEAHLDYDDESAEEEDHHKHDEECEEIEGDEAAGGEEGQQSGDGGEGEANPEEVVVEAAGGDATARTAKSANKSAQSDKRSKSASRQDQSQAQDQAEAAAKRAAAPSKNDVTLQLIAAINRYNQRTGKVDTRQQQLNLFEHQVGLSVLDGIRQEIHRRTEPLLRPIMLKKGRKPDVMRSNQALQKAIKREDRQRQDERAILQADAEMNKTVYSMMRLVFTFSKFHAANKSQLMKAKAAFTARILERPFDVPPEQGQTLRCQGAEVALIKAKQQIQGALRLLQLHPCYLIRILTHKAPKIETKKQIVRQLFTVTQKSQQLRLNYLLIPIFKAVLEDEMLDRAPLIEGEAYHPYIFGKDCQMLSIYIFRRVFKSDQRNIDTICCIACHIINSILTQFTQTQNGKDPSLDVTNIIFKEQKAAADASKKGKKDGEAKSGGGAEQAADNLKKFVRAMLEAIVNDTVLKEGAQYFQFKQSFQEQLDYVKKQYKGVGAGADEQTQGNFLVERTGVEAENVKERVPAIRFTEEVYLMLQILIRTMRETPAYKKNDDYISSQVLGLAFGNQLHKVAANVEMYLYPYIAKARVLALAEQQMKEAHVVNIKNAFSTIQCVLQGQPAFAEANDGAVKQIVEGLNRDLRGLYDLKLELLKRLQGYGKEVTGILSYKNFEQQMLHNLEPQGTHVVVGKKFLGELLQLLRGTADTYVLQEPHSKDPLHGLLRGIEQETVDALLGNGHPTDKTTLKLKTRLFVNPDYREGKRFEAQLEESLAQYVRCRRCDAILTQDIAVTNYDASLVLPAYEPQDAQSLVTQYCTVLKAIDENPTKEKQIGKKKDAERPQLHNNMLEFIDAARTATRRQLQHQVETQIQDFEKKLRVEVQNIQVKEYQTYKRERARGARKKPKEDPWDWFEAEPAERTEAQRQEAAAHTRDQTDRAILALIEASEAKVHQRVEQQYRLGIIRKHMDHYLWPHLYTKMEAFKSQILAQSQAVRQNYQYGLANKDLLCLREKPALRQMKAVHSFTATQKPSRSLSKALTTEQKQRIRGFLSLSAADLLADGTITGVRLSELKPLIAESKVVLIESDDRQRIEFKIVFQELKKPLCGPTKVVDEQVLINFDIYPKELKMMLAMIEAELAEKRKQNAGKPEKKAAADEDNKDDNTGKLVFPQNDALTFDPQKFAALVTRMERQRSAYVLRQDGEGDEG